MSRESKISSDDAMVLIVEDSVYIPILGNIDSSGALGNLSQSHGAHRLHVDALQM